MLVRFVCPSCEHSGLSSLDGGTRELLCEPCGARLEVPEGAVEDGAVRRCVICPCHDLYIRKDFPQGLGVTIVVTGLAISCVTWFFHQVTATFAILIATAAVDAVLYLVMGNLLQCYSCQAQYREVAGLDTFAPFNLETHERYRQQAARMAEVARTGSSPN